MTTSNAEKLPVHSREAERALLGTLLRAPKFADDVLQVVQADDFYVFAHQKVFEAIAALHGDGIGVDAVTVADWLESTKLMPDVGGPVFLVELWEASPTPSEATALRYAEIIRARAITREVNHLARELVSETDDYRGDPQELLNSVTARVLDLSDKRIQSKMTWIADDSAAAIDDLNDQTRAALGKDAIFTGWTELDDLTGGLHGGQLIVIAARTSIGKSAAALNIAHHVAIDCGLPTLLFSLEMSKREIAHRINARQTGINSARFNYPKSLTPDDCDLLLDTARVFKGKPFAQDNSPSQTVAEIAAKARQFKRKHGLRLLIVDYLQLVDGNMPFAARHQEVSAISKGLKQLAGTLSVPIVALAQLNRESEKRETKKPQLSDLAQSGAIEQDADVVLLLQPPDENNEQLKDTLLLHVAKNRNGPRVQITLLYERRNGRIGNYSWDAIPAQPFAGRG